MTPLVVSIVRVLSFVTVGPPGLRLTISDPPYGRLILVLADSCLRALRPSDMPRVR